MSELSRERAHWERMAASDPMWFILTEPGKEGKWDDREFFETGRRELTESLELLREKAGITPRWGAALDFGCGLGRATQALAERFQHVHGVDISTTMVAEARARNRHGDRVTYHANATDRLPMIATGSIDFLYSRLVLQHIPRSAALSYLGEFVRVLEPGGLAMFQLMMEARPLGVRLRHALRDLFPNVYRWTRDFVSRRPRFEMNVLSEQLVRRAIESRSARIVALLEDSSSDEVFTSRWVVVRRDPD